MDIRERIGHPIDYGKLLPRARVLEMVGLGKTRVYELERDNAFPKGRKVGKVALYVEAKVRTFIAAVAEGRPYAPGPQNRPLQLYEPN
ncbi:helix-turn-helix transcriptional regulator [Acuticoccus mangrovi]|uniref:AlpA family phage regulatory protein n=1 Tax=Acuticoccus mangrovi TaxID=2796142 RepID=A0A934MGE6_9HYPH|nr:AlpA family phage regulatory protein [Acuticoccus mangrovi]MBJ3775855.1 AlpA family phage regulatory protein [Acuticoccus mangrovi]